MINFRRLLCTRCGRCRRDCPEQIITPDADGYPSLHPDRIAFCIHCQHCLAVCPHGAIEIDGITPESCAPSGRLPTPDDFANLIRQRRSVRFFKPQTVDVNTLDKLADALRWAPSGCNDHRQYFAIVSGEKQMSFFRNHTNRILRRLFRWRILQLLYPNSKRFAQSIMAGEDLVYRNAPYMIVAAVPKNAPCREADPWIALAQFDDHLQTLGLGSCYCGFAVHLLRFSAKMRKQLAIPAGYKIGAVLLFGHPDVEYARPTNPPPVKTFIFQ